MRVAGVPLMALLGACAGQDSPSATGSTPAALASNYRQIVAGHVRETFFDPYSIRDAEIGAPKMAAGPSLNRDGGFYTPWVVCVRANAKNRMGAYTGKHVTAIGMSGTEVVNSWDEAHYSRMVCEGVAYAPFPEIDAIAAVQTPAPAKKSR